MSCDTELVSQLHPGVHQFITMVTDEELAAAEEHVRVCERFITVGGKLLERLKIERKNYEGKVQQAGVS